MRAWAIGLLTVLSSVVIYYTSWPLFDFVIPNLAAVIVVLLAAAVFGCRRTTDRLPTALLANLVVLAGSLALWLLFVAVAWAYEWSVFLRTLFIAAGIATTVGAGTILGLGTRSLTGRLALIGS